MNKNGTCRNPGGAGMTWMETGDIYENCIHPDFTEPKSIWDGSKIPEWCPLSEVA